MLDIIMPLILLLLCVYGVVTVGSPWWAVACIIGAVGAVSWLADEVSYYLRFHFNDWDGYDAD